MTPTFLYTMEAEQDTPTTTQKGATTKQPKPPKKRRVKYGSK